jgi:hypothetical protein
MDRKRENLTTKEDTLRDELARRFCEKGCFGQALRLVEQNLARISAR